MSAAAPVKRALLALIARAEKDGEALEAGFIRWLITDATPEDWHRFVFGANWDSTEPDLFRWILLQPECDRATALLLFWRVHPEYYVEEPAADLTGEDAQVMVLARERWLSGAYTRSEFAFFLKDEYPPDLDDLDRRFPERAAALIPPSMRVNLFGRMITQAGTIEGVPLRFWPSEFHDQDEGNAGMKQLGRLNHIGIATPSIERAAEAYHFLLGASAIGKPFDLPAQGVRVCFIDAPNTQIELIQPLGDTSPIAAFLRKNPAGGQHHLCFEVPDIGLAVLMLQHKGATVLGEPRIGAHGTPVVFLHPRDMGGVLIELMETPVAGGAHA